MEALLIILAVLIGIIIIGLIIWVLGSISLAIALFTFRFFPFVVGIIGGLIIWATWNKYAGNLIVIIGIVVGIFWEKHIKKNGCNCIIHKIYIHFFE